jgi:O-antigen biosynthesis protein
MASTEPRTVSRPIEPPDPVPPRIDAQNPPPLSAGIDALRGIRPTAERPCIRLVLHEFNGTNVFAGIRTALLAGAWLARHLERPLRVVLLQDSVDPASVDTLLNWLRREPRGAPLAGNVTVVSVASEPEEAFHPSDLWIVTYWTTAVAATRACEAGLIDPGHVIYLVQDYEPGFFGWSDNAAMAATTYRQGFRVVVNSMPLARYLADRADLAVPPDHVFTPAVDLAALARAADAWRPDPDGRLRVLFYGRPHHPRNLFRIGLEALRLWIATLEPHEMPVLSSAGDRHPPYALGPDAVITSLGTLGLEGYFGLLARTDVALSLMMSPHPSHLSLEPPMAGVPTITNGFGAYREPWVDGLHVADADPVALARGLGDVARTARGVERHRQPAPPTSLGRPLPSVMRAVAAQF